MLSDSGRRGFVLFYRRYGFSTVFYTKEQRFTAFHSFPVKGDYHHVEMMRVMRSGVRLTGFSVVGSAMFCIPDAISLTFCPI